MQTAADPEPTRVGFANVAGARLVHGDGYDPQDRSADFGAMLALGRPQVQVLSELACEDGSTQLEDIAGIAMGRAPKNLGLARKGFSPSHVPGVETLGLGIASLYPLHDAEWTTFPDPGFPMSPVVTGTEPVWHKKGALAARCETPEGDLHIVAVQIHPVHRATTVDGAAYSYLDGPGYEHGMRVAEILGAWFDELGIRSAVLAGDMNMDDPRAFFTRLGAVRLLDAFGPGRPPATTPKGRSIDRAFVTEDLRPRGHRVLAPLVDGDRFADHYGVVVNVGLPRPAAAKGPRLALSEVPRIGPRAPSATSGAALRTAASGAPAPGHGDGRRRGAR